MQGRVTFNDEGTRVPSHVEVGQYRLTEDTVDRISVAYVKPLNETSAIFFYKDLENNQTVYPSKFYIVNNYNNTLIVR